METHIIDATNKSPGRLAAHIAGLLYGKHKPDFAPHKDAGDQVLVRNVAKMKITGRKADQKKYRRHSGYPGGLKEQTLGKLLKDKPEEVLKEAVWGMLPPNRLRKIIVKKLRFED